MTTKTILPAGWRWAKLGDVTRVVAGTTPKSGVSEYWDNGNIVWITPTDLGSNSEKDIFSSARQITQAGFESCGLEIIPASSVVLSSRAPIGHLGIARVELCTNQGCKSFVPSDDVNSEFLYFALKQAVPTLQKLGSGATFAEVSKTQLENFDIPLPPLTEQQRIAARLNEQMTAVAQARQAAEEQLRAARELPSAYLQEVFEGQEAKKWPMQRLAEVSAIGAGITLGRKLFNVQTRKVPYLRVANVKDGFLDLSDVYNIDATDADVAKCTLKYGDLLLTEGGDPDKLGRGTFWEEQIPECLHQNHIFRVRFDQSKFSARFMAYQVGSPYGKAYFLAHAKQTTGIATINQKVLGNFPLLIPPLEEQEKIANGIKEKLAEAETLKQALEAQLAEINQLPSALLRRAFSGEG